ncbi:hypothetical protein ABIG06_005763 [Bradyrhizobium sp. USDA 326]
MHRCTPEQYRAGIEDAVAEAGGVGQKLADRDRALRRLDIGKARSALLEHLAIAELRQEFLDSIIEPDAAFSTSSMIAQVMKILVLENARKIWSGRSAVLASRSAKRRIADRPPRGRAAPPRIRRE